MPRTAMLMLSSSCSPIQTYCRGYRVVDAQASPAAIPVDRNTVQFAVKGKSVEIGSISDTVSLELSEGGYALSVEFIDPSLNGVNEINVRLNKGSCDFDVLRADAEINDQGGFDVNAKPAS